MSGPCTSRRVFLSLSFLLALILVFQTVAEAEVSCINETGACFMTVQAAINNADPYQTVVVINNTHEHNENVVINVTGLTLTSNVSVKPLIWSASARTLVISADNVTVSRLQIKSNGTLDSVSVISNSCSQRLEASKTQLAGIWC